MRIILAFMISQFLTFLKALNHWVLMICSKYYRGAVHMHCIAVLKLPGVFSFSSPLHEVRITCPHLACSYVHVYVILKPKQRPLKSDHAAMARVFSLKWNYFFKYSITLVDKIIQHRTIFIYLFVKFSTWGSITKFHLVLFLGGLQPFNHCLYPKIWKWIHRINLRLRVF